MPSIGRKTLKSVRARERHIDTVFKHIGYTIIILYFIFISAIWLSHRESFRIDRVELTGVHAVDASEIKLIASNALRQKLFWKIDRDNAVLYPKYQLARNIYLLDGRVKTVDSEVFSKKELKIHVTEYAPQLLMCPNMVATSSDGSTACYLGDDEGYIFSKAPAYSGYFFPVYIVHDESLHEGNIIGTHVLPAKEFIAIQNFLNALRAAGFIPKRIDHIGDLDYEIATERGWLIRWSSTASPEASVANLESVLRTINKESQPVNELKIIDLRFGNKIFYQ